MSDRRSAGECPVVIGKLSHQGTTSPTDAQLFSHVPGGALPGARTNVPLSYC